jgi:hypothetical protein
MAKPQAHPKTVIALCRALVEVTANRRAAYWLSIDRSREMLGIPLADLDEAIAYAVEHHLVRVDGEPARSLVVTYDGIDLAQESLV